METIRVLIVDDEDPARLRLRKLLEKESNVELLGECSDGGEAVTFIREHKPDLVFLDIQMKEMDGFGVLEELGHTPDTLFVFVTAYNQYAVDAFETYALDYLLKPFSDKRFRQAIERARERLRLNHISAYSDRLIALLNTYKEVNPETTRPASEPAYSNRLVLKTGNRLIFVDPDQVDWIEAEGVYVRLHTGEKAYLLRESLSNVEERLDPGQFMRIHRSTIVNIGRIREIVPHFNGGSIVMLCDGTRLKLSRTYRDRVHTTLG